MGSREDTDRTTGERGGSGHGERRISYGYTARFSRSGRDEGESVGNVPPPTRKTFGEGVRPKRPTARSRKERENTYTYMCMREEVVFFLCVGTPPFLLLRVGTGKRVESECT